MSATKSSPSVEPDLLSRANFVQHCHDVLEVLDVHAGAVLGLQGHWGSGKTWVLQALKQSLSEAPSGHDTHWVWIDVNPWMFSGSNQVVEQVLDEIGKQFLGGQVAAQIKSVKGAVKTVQGIGEQVLKFRSLLGKARGHIDWVEAVSPQVAALIKLAAPAADEADEKDDSKPEPKGDKLPDRQSLNELKEALTKKLQGVSFTVVIAYDDLDRMSPVEVCEVIQAIKAVANFPNVIHLMAYDEAVVANALEKHLKIDNGRAYLEKIVSYEVVVPAPLEHLFEQALKAKVQAAMELERKMLPNVPDQDLSDDDWSTALSLTADLMQSPRDVQRLIVRFQLAVRKLGGKVDLKDLLLIEALALKQPGLIKDIGLRRKAWMKPVGVAEDRNLPQVPQGSSTEVRRALAFVFGSLTEPVVSRQRGPDGLDDDVNWLSWWQWQPDHDGVAPVNFLASFKDEAAFRQSRWFSRIEDALLIFDAKFGGHLQNSKDSCIQVMARALLKDGREDGLLWVLGRMSNAQDFLLNEIRNASPAVRARLWRTASATVQEGNLVHWLLKSREVHGIRKMDLEKVRQRFLVWANAELSREGPNHIRALLTVRSVMELIQPDELNDWLNEVLGVPPEPQRLQEFTVIAQHIEGDHPALLRAVMGRHSPADL